MTQTLQARTITLRDLIDDFKLDLTRDEEFFRDRQDNLPAISDKEKAYLDQIKESCFNLIKYPLSLEKIVQSTILGLILFTGGGFFLSPFHI